MKTIKIPPVSKLSDSGLQVALDFLITPTGRVKNMKFFCVLLNEKLNRMEIE